MTAVPGAATYLFKELAIKFVGIFIYLSLRIPHRLRLRPVFF